MLQRAEAKWENRYFPGKNVKILQVCLVKEKRKTKSGLMVKEKQEIPKENQEKKVTLGKENI